jgi:hypothetical protein
VYCCGGTPCAFAACSINVSAMIASSAAFRPSYSACVACACSEGFSACHLSSSSFIVTVRLPTRAATSAPPWEAAGCCAGAEQASSSRRAAAIPRGRGLAIM